MNNKLRSLKELYIYINGNNSFEVNVFNNLLKINKKVELFLFNDEYYISENVYNLFAESINKTSNVDVQFNDEILNYHKIEIVHSIKPIKKVALKYSDLNKKKKIREKYRKSKFLVNSVFDITSKYFIEEIEGQYIFYINTETQLESYYGFGLIQSEEDKTIKQNKKSFNVKDVFLDLINDVLFESKYLEILRFYFLIISLFVFVFMVSMFKNSLDYNLNYSQYYNSFFHVINVIFILFFICYYFNSTLYSVSKNTLYEQNSNLTPIITNNHIIYSNGIYHKMLFSNYVSFYTVKSISKYRIKDNLNSRQNVILECFMCKEGK